MENRKTIKRVLIIIAAVVGGLVALAVILGVLNALLADGKWSFGWNDYRYDDSGYSVGNASVPYDTVTRIEIDWIDGEVELEACRDAYISLDESAEEELPESAQVHWAVTDGGKTLSVKYRKSSYYFNMGSQDRNKKLIVRIPEKLMAEMEIEVETVSSKVTVKGISASSFEAETVSGNLFAVGNTFGYFSAESTSGNIVFDGTVTESFSADSTSGELVLVSGICPESVDIETVSGDMTLTLPRDVSMTLYWDSTSGRLSSDIALTQNGDDYTAGGGAARVNAESVSGNLIIKVKE